MLSSLTNVASKLVGAIPRGRGATSAPISASSSSSSPDHVSSSQVEEEHDSTPRGEANDETACVLSQKMEAGGAMPTRDSPSPSCCSDKGVTSGDGARSMNDNAAIRCSDNEANERTSVLLEDSITPPKSAHCRPVWSTASAGSSSSSSLTFLHDEYDSQAAPSVDVAFPTVVQSQRAIAHSITPESIKGSIVEESTQSLSPLTHHHREEAVASPLLRQHIGASLSRDDEFGDDGENTGSTTCDGEQVMTNSAGNLEHQKVLAVQQTTRDCDKQDSRPIDSSTQHIERQREPVTIQTALLSEFDEFDDEPTTNDAYMDSASRRRRQAAGAGSLTPLPSDWTSAIESMDTVSAAESSSSSAAAVAASRQEILAPAARFDSNGKTTNNGPKIQLSEEALSRTGRFEQDKSARHQQPASNELEEQVIAHHTRTALFLESQNDLGGALYELQQALRLLDQDSYSAAACYDHIARLCGKRGNGRGELRAYRASLDIRSRMKDCQGTPQTTTAMEHSSNLTAVNSTDDSDCESLDEASSISVIATRDCSLRRNPSRAISKQSLSDPVTSMGSPTTEGMLLTVKDEGATLPDGSRSDEKTQLSQRQSILESSPKSEFAQLVDSDESQSRRSTRGRFACDDSVLSCPLGAELSEHRMATRSQRTSLGSNRSRANVVIESICAPKPERSYAAWSPCEDSILREKRALGYAYNDISKLLPGRSAKACSRRFENLSKRPKTVIPRESSSGASPRKQSSTCHSNDGKGKSIGGAIIPIWTAEEDALLLEKRTRRWSRIRGLKSASRRAAPVSHNVHPRAKRQRTTLKDIDEGSIRRDDHSSNGGWTVAMDDLLKQKRAQRLTWPQISRLIPNNKSASACANRYHKQQQQQQRGNERAIAASAHNCAVAALTAWSEAEDALLVDRKRIGLTYKAIADLLPGRSEGTCSKRRYVLTVEGNQRSATAPSKADSTVLNGSVAAPSAAASASASTPASLWSKAEDALLVEKRQSRLGHHQTRYKAIADLLPGRTEGACSARYHKLVVEGKAEAAMGQAVMTMTATTTTRRKTSYLRRTFTANDLHLVRHCQLVVDKNSNKKKRSFATAF